MLHIKFFINRLTTGFRTIFLSIVNISLQSKKALGILIFFFLIIVALFFLRCILKNNPSIRYFIIFFGSVLLSLYRPNVPQYSWNVWYDHIIPIIFLVTPGIIILIINPFTSWPYSFVLLLVLHVTITTPLLQKWSKIRRSDLSFTETTSKSCMSPKSYTHISIALIYPLLWGIFFSLFGYLRLGHGMEIMDYFLIIFESLILSLFLFYPLFLWFLAFCESILGLRNYLWEEFLYLVVYQRLLKKTKIKKSILAEEIENRNLAKKSLNNPTNADEKTNLS